MYCRRKTLLEFRICTPISVDFSQSLVKRSPSDNVWTCRVRANSELPPTKATQYTSSTRSSGTWKTKLCEHPLLTARSRPNAQFLFLFYSEETQLFNLFLYKSWFWGVVDRVIAYWIHKCATAWYAYIGEYIWWLISSVALRSTKFYPIGTIHWFAETWTYIFDAFYHSIQFNPRLLWVVFLTSNERQVCVSNMLDNCHSPFTLHVMSNQCKNCSLFCQHTVYLSNITRS